MTWPGGPCRSRWASAPCRRRRDRRRGRPRRPDRDPPRGRSRSTGDITGGTLVIANRADDDFLVAQRPARGRGRGPSGGDREPVGEGADIAAGVARVRGRCRSRWRPCGRPCPAASTRVRALERGPVGPDPQRLGDRRPAAIGRVSAVDAQHGRGLDPAGPGEVPLPLRDPPQRRDPRRRPQGPDRHPADPLDRRQGPARRLRPERDRAGLRGRAGGEGADALRKFCRDGGTIVCLEDSCNWAIDDLGLGVTNVGEGAEDLRVLRPRARSSA